MVTIDILSCVVTLYQLKFSSLTKDPKKIINCNPQNKTNLLKELYKRLIVPLYIPVLMLIPYLLILSSKEKINYTKLKFVTFLIGMTTIIFSEGVIRFVSKNLYENLFIFISPIIIFSFL